MDELSQLLSSYKESIDASDRYVDDLLSQAGGDRDFVIKQLKREHDLALGTDDQARAQFLESVADKLEQRIGTIPYDYNVGVTRTNEDLSRVTEVTNRNKDRALSRLAEDEQTWRSNFAKESELGKASQQEELAARGILTGTRSGAEGLAGKEVKQFDQKLADQISLYGRELGRTREDITTEAGDTLFEAGRGAKRTLEDLKTQARRGATGVQDKVSFGTEAAQRQYEAQKKELERLRAREKASAQSGVLSEYYYGR